MTLAGVARRRAPEQDTLQGGPAGAWEEEDEDEAAAARVLRAPPQEADEEFEREFAELMGGAEPQVRLGTHHLQNYLSKWPLPSLFDGHQELSPTGLSHAVMQAEVLHFWL